MKNKKANRFTFDSRIDYGLILPAFMLILIGLYALYVAVSHDHPTQATNLVVQQGTWVIVGLFVALLGFVLMIAGFILSIIKQYSYAMTTFVLYDAVADGTYDGPNSVISKSKELMNGNKWRYFCLQFSFIGWYILTGLTFGLLHFYTLPYTTTATLFFYEDLLDKAE